MAGTLPVTTIGKAENHEYMQMRYCCKLDVLRYLRVGRRAAGRPFSDCQGCNRRYRYVDESRSSPACAQDIKGSTWSVRHRESALQPEHKAKTAILPRRNYGGGIRGRQCNLGCKNTTAVTCSQRERSTNSHCFSSRSATTAAALQ